MSDTEDIDLYKIEIMQDERYGESHAAITVVGPGYYLAYQVRERYSLDDVLEAARYVAGVLARMAVSLSDDLGDVRSHCGCRSRYRCGISGGVYADVLDTLDLALSVDFFVPLPEVGKWVERIRSTLAEIADLDSTEPDAEVFAWWSSGRPQHERPMKPEEES